LQRIISRAALFTFDDGDDGCIACADEGL